MNYTSPSETVSVVIFDDRISKIPKCNDFPILLNLHSLRNKSCEVRFGQFFSDMLKFSMCGKM